MLCPICAGEFQKQASDCPNCGCQLVPESLSAESAESAVYTKTKQTAPIRFVELCRPRLFPIAMLIKQTLEQHGIVAWIPGGNIVSLLPQLAFGGELRVLVDGDQIDLAREVYKAYFEGDEDVDYIIECEAD